MLVDLSDGRCRTCGGQLDIEDVEDSVMYVNCLICGDSYETEPDAFGDGCMTYYFPLMTIKLLGKEDTADDE